jgi:hydrogenase-4 component B
MIENLLVAVILTYIMGGLSALLSKSSKFTIYVSFIASLAASILTVAISISVLILGFEGQDALRVSYLQNATPVGSVIDFMLDDKAAFFTLVVGLVSSAVSIYSIGYAKGYLGKRNVSALGFLFNIFILSMILVVLSNNAFAFLVFWELMSLTSFFLVIYEHEKESNVKSGLIYLIMTHLGTAFIIGSFLTVYAQSGDLSFDSFRQSSASIPPLMKGVVFVLAFIGFGTKAGIVPLHIWLPKAHPSAPSNVSALMSAVMLKVAIYGLVRTIFDFSGIGPSQDFTWWGILMFAAGSVSSLIGVLYAVVEHDIKRALAFHSIENIGIIFIGLGISVIFYSFNLMPLSMLALAASMYHTMNHAIFKGLLFMGAGSVISRIHIRDIERMGGLIKKMPWTALFFLIGAISIAGFPPFNGFISEWLTMQALLSSYQIPSVPVQIIIAFGSLVLALTLGVAAATFVKLFGISFLSKGRSDHVNEAKEVPRMMLLGKGILASLCIILGIFPAAGINLIASAFDFPSSMQLATPFDALSIQNENNPAAPNFASLSIPVAIVLLGSMGLAVFGFARVIGGKQKKTVYGTWDCGFGGLTERMEYTATSLSQPIRSVFKALYKPQYHVQKDFHFNSNQYLPKSIKVESATRDVFEERLYSPTVHAAIGILDRIRRIQTGKVNAYILYIMITLLILLVIVRVFS